MRILLAAAVAIGAIGAIGPIGAGRAAPPAGDAPDFAVREGTVLSKQFTITHDLTVQKIELGRPGGDAMSQQQLDVSSTVELAVTDTYRKVAPHRPLETQRVYKASSLHLDFSFSDPAGKKIPEAWDAETLMKQKSVVFVWVPEEKDYSKHYDEAEGLEEHLANLAEDLDFRCLLPDPASREGRPLREGESWPIDLASLPNLFTPGGNIPMSYVKGGNTGLFAAVAAGVGGPLHPVFGGAVKGNCRATWSKTEDSPGGRLARIELALDVDTEADRTDITRRMLRQDEDAESSPIRHAGVRWKFTGTGTLLWNLEAGRFEKLEVSGREEVTSDVQFARGEESPRQSLSMAGGMKIVASVLPPKK